MTKEDKELLLKDLCARFPYGVYVQFEGNADIPRKLTGYTNYYNELFDVGSFGEITIEEIKPYLRPMSNMTEEEQEQFLDLIIPIDGGKAVVEENNIEKYNEFIYSHHIDNKGFIEKGLALEAPEDMYLDGEKERFERLKKIFPIDMAKKEELEAAKKLNAFNAIKYLEPIVGGLKTAKIYYDLYIRDEKDYGL